MPGLGWRRWPNPACLAPISSASVLLSGKCERVIGRSAYWSPYDAPEVRRPCSGWVPHTPIEYYMQEPIELRAHFARSLHGRTAAIVKGAIGVYPFAGMENVGADERARLTDLVLQLVIAAVRDGRIDSRDVRVADLHRLATEKVAIRPLFTVVYLVERSALDALALDDAFGVASESWAALTQTVRQASLDAYAAIAESMSGGVFETTITDSLTTLHTQAVFLAALEKEVQRSERFGRSFALILLDIDHLADINARHGYGAGDRVLERVGIVVRNHFRNTDWAARLSEDTFAVLLPEIQGADAERLAERMRVTVQERLQLHDYRSDQESPVTISVAVLVVESVDRNVKAEQLVARAEAAIERARRSGGNRVERAESIVGRASVPTRDIVPID